MPIFNALDYSKTVDLANGEPDKQVNLTGLEQIFLLNLLTGIPWTESQACHAIWVDRANLSPSAKEAAAALVDGTIHKLMIGQGEEIMKVAVISDTKTVGANGGTFTAGTWRQRDLNTIAQTDSIVSVSLNNITVLETGKYRIAAFAPATGVVYHQARLVRNGVELAVGQAALCGSVPVNSIAPVVWCGALTAGDILQLQHRCSATYATYGMGGGEGISWGNVVFSVVEIVQI